MSSVKDSAHGIRTVSVARHSTIRFMLADAERRSRPPMEISKQSRWKSQNKVDQEK